MLDLQLVISDELGDITTIFQMMKIKISKTGGKCDLIIQGLVCSLSSTSPTLNARQAMVPSGPALHRYLEFYSLQYDSFKAKLFSCFCKHFINIHWPCDNHNFDKNSD